MNFSMFTTLDGLLMLFVIFVSVMTVVRMSDRCKSILLLVQQIARQNEAIDMRLYRIEERQQGEDL